MGGLGSTRWKGKKTATTVESCTAVAAHHVIREVALSRPTLKGKVPSGAVLTAQNRLGRIETSVGFAASTPRFGGQRFWFLCPRCLRRGAKLYLPPDGTGFACRACHGLTYHSSRWSHRLERQAAARERRWDRWVRKMESDRARVERECSWLRFGPDGRMDFQASCSALVESLHS